MAKSKTKTILKVTGITLALATVGTLVGLGVAHPEEAGKFFTNVGTSIKNIFVKDDPSPELTVQAQFKVEEQEPIIKNVATGGLLEDIPENPVKDGYTFKGWAVEGTTEVVDFTTHTFTENVTFVAIFEEIKEDPVPSPELTVQAGFKVEGVQIATRAVATGALLENLPENPVKDGYKFLGWAVEGTTEVVDFTTHTFTENVTFNAIFELLNVARCWVNDEEYIDIVDPTNEKMTTLPTEIDGREVLGWGNSGSDGQSIDFSETSIIGTRDLYPIFAIDFVVSDGVITGYTGTAEEVVLSPEAIAEAGGKTYSTWFSIESRAFEGDSTIKKLVVDGMIIREDAFAGMTKLEEIELYSPMFETTSDVYGSTSSLKKIIAHGYFEFSAEALQNCTGLESITIVGSDSDFSFMNFDNLSAPTSTLKLYVDESKLEQCQEDLSLVEYFTGGIYAIEEA